jgi:hypothetical protein
MADDVVMVTNDVTVSATGVAPDIKARPEWAEVQVEIDRGTFGPRALLNRMAAERIAQSMEDMGCEGCGISSSDINHEVYGAVSWAMQHNLDRDYVWGYLGGDV